VYKKAIIYYTVRTCTPYIRLGNMNTEIDTKRLDTTEGDLVWFHVPGETEKRLGMVVHLVKESGIKKTSHYIIWSASGWWVRAQDTVVPIL